MAYYEKKRVRELLSPNPTLANELVFAPLSEWTDNDVWMFLMQYKNPWGYQNNSYEWFILNKYIKPAKQAGAVPILVTPVTRRSSDGTANISAHVAYQQALIQLGKEYNLPVIDATKLTSDYYTEIGAENTAVLHCWAETSHSALDNTHLSEQGASDIADMIAEQTKELGLTIGKYKK